MDVIKLIRGVRCREPLWDRKHSFYHDRTVTMALWDDVALALAVDSETARTKWKGLRDTFRGELRKLHKTVVGGKPRTSTNWEYFDEMLFVKDQIYSNKRHLEEIASLARNHHGLQPNMDDSDSSDQHKVNGATPNERLDAPSSPESDPEAPESGQTDTRDLTQNGETDEKDVERKKRLKAEENNVSTTYDDGRKTEKALEDDDFNFLMSLLPQMRCLPTSRNLFVRLKIQELLYNEMTIPTKQLQKPQEQ